jgi:hypothetical protein
MNRLCRSVLTVSLLAAGRVTAQEAGLEPLKQQMQQLQQQMQQLQEKIGQLETNRPAVQLPPLQPAAPWSPSQPIPVARAGGAYMNVSFDTVVNAGWSTEPKVDKVLELGDHDPSQRGFSLRNAELSLDGAVDPYLRGFANIVLKLDNNNETSIELEEAYGQTTDLPYNLQLKAGQFFAAFGRQNQQHPHAWAFVDQPLIMNRLVGPDGLRNVGTQLSWLAPTPFYSELSLGVFNGGGGTTFSFRDLDNTYGRTPVDRGLRGPGDLLFVPRASASFDLNDEQTLVLGASGAFGPNDSGAHTRTEIYSVDAYWKWKSPEAHGGFPFVSWQTEAMLRQYEAGNAPLPAETLEDYGLYSQVLWGYRLGWVAGLRGEFVTGNHGANDVADTLLRGDRFRLSPNLTYYPTEFSKLRLQYNYDHGQAFGDEHSVWVQLEFLLGAHAAHKF